MKVIVFEQTGDVLEKRFGFRVAEYGLRWVFQRVPDHPLPDRHPRRVPLELAWRRHGPPAAPRVRV